MRVLQQQDEPQPGQFHISASRWFNGGPIEPANDKAALTVVYVFQMLCAGCVYHGLPMISYAHQALSSKDVQFIGLHSVFENHEAMNDTCLEVFLKEFRVNFPVAVDKRLEGNPIPQTMGTYGFLGTPTFLVLDGQARILWRQFGISGQFDLISKIQQLQAKSAH